MFEPPPELASDLEWMLQSGQAPPAMLAEALIATYYLPLARLAWAELGDPEQGRAAGLDILATALTSTFRLRRFPDPEAWFFALALETLDRRQPAHRLAVGTPGVLALADLPPILRRPLLFTHLLGWEAGRVASVLGMLPEAVTARVAEAEERLAAVLPAGEDLAAALRAQWSEVAYNPEAVTAEALARAAIRTRTIRRRARLGEIGWLAAAMVGLLALVWGVNRLLPEPEVGVVTPVIPSATAPTTRLPPARASYVARTGDTLDAIAARFGMMPAALRRFNRLPPGAEVAPGARLLLPAVADLIWLAQAAPSVGGGDAVATLLPPRTETVIAALLRARPNWEAIWLDAEVRFHGVPGYVGPPDAMRFQVWGSTRDFLVLRGRPNGPVEEVLLRHAGALFRAAPPDAADFQPISGRLALDRTFFGALLTLFRPPHGPMVRAAADQFRYDGEETLAGRLVYRIAVNQPGGARTATIWLDAASGFPLRLHRFDPDTQRLVSEVTLQAVRFDPILPENLMDPSLPWRGGFASDASGAPEPLPVATSTPPPEAAFAPPPNLDWSRQALELRPIPGRPPQAEVQVVAAGQALGVLQPLNPFQPQPCARSDDGRGLAWTYAAGASASWLTWARLDALDRLGRRDYPDGGASVFAFSPDGRQLAVFELRGPSGMISLIAVGGGTARPLLPLDDARSLVWKPDGAELGLIGRVTSPRLEEMVMVVRVRDGAVLYRQSIDTNAGNQRQEWPMEAWGVAFPVEMTTLADCLAAP